MAKIVKYGLFFPIFYFNLFPSRCVYYHFLSFFPFIFSDYPDRQSHIIRPTRFLQISYISFICFPHFVYKYLIINKLYQSLVKSLVILKLILYILDSFSLLYFSNLQFHFHYRYYFYDTQVILLFV